MQRQLMLRDEYNREFRMLDGLRSDVGQLEASLAVRQIHIREEMLAGGAAEAEASVVDLQDTCAQLEERLEHINRAREPGTFFGPLRKKLSQKNLLLKANLYFSSYLQPSNVTTAATSQI